MKRLSSLLLFLIGTFSVTQIRVVGSIGISELPIFILAPFIFVIDYRILRYDGFLPVIWLALLACVGCCVSSFCNQTSFPFFLRGFASPYSIFAISVVLHRILRKNLGGLKWFFLGICLSWVINTFFFHSATEEIIAESEGGGTRGIMASSIFLISRLNGFLMAPIAGWYLQTPLLYSVFTPILWSIYCLFSTASGRSAALGTLGTLAIVLIGQKRRSQMERLRKHFVPFLFFAIALGLAFKGFYQVAATNGWLGEQAQTKYEQQSKGGRGILALLMGGRGETFVGLFACLDRPLVGHGPWALDTSDYYVNYLAKYGQPEDYDYYVRTMQYYRRIGAGSRMRLIPAHSHIVVFWLWYGILGLPFWLYVLKLIYDWCRNCPSAIPQWYGYFAVSIPSFLWGIVFSPFGARIQTVTIIVCLLMARAVQRGRIQLPMEMIREIEKMERRNG